MLVTVIIPVYNVEKYIKRCLDSVIRQTYKNLEIIIVNDGSTDNSGKICDEYAKLDNRIIVIHKENGGLSAARNTGIEKSTGEYLCFIDSDDYVELNMIEDLYNACIKNEVKMVWANKFRELENGKIFIDKTHEQECIIDRKQAYNNILLHDTTVCDKLFKKELFNNVLFPIGKLYEDMITVNKLIEQCEEIYCLEKAYYHYVQRKNSIVHKKFNIKKLDYIENAKELCNFILERYPDLSKQCEAYYILILCTILCDMYPQKKQYLKYYTKYMKEIKKYKKQIKNNKYISKLKKIMVYLLSYKLVWLVIIIKKIKDVIKYK